MANGGFAYGGLTILSHPLFVEAILPFLLVFTIVFAILEKSKVLGDGKRQIDAIVSLVVGLLAISFAQAVGIIVQLIPFLAVSLVIILVLLLMLGSFQEEGKLVPKGIKWILIALVPIALAIAVLMITGTWNYIYDIVLINPNNIVANIIFIAAMIGAIVAVIIGAGNKSSSKS